jgi:hypothetical protein
MDVPDRIHFSKLVHNENSEIVQGDTLNTDTTGHLHLSDRLQGAYNAFSKTYKDDALINLSPLDIFTIYYYCEEQKDYKTQYALFIKDPEVNQTFKSYEEYELAVKQPSNQASNGKFLDSLKSAPLQERMQSKTKAYILISKDSGQGFGFGLTKNKKGIWKVNWMPIQ